MFHTAIASLQRTGTQSYNHLLFLLATYTALCESFESSLGLTSTHQMSHTRCGDNLFTSPLFLGSQAGYYCADKHYVQEGRRAQVQLSS